MRTYKRKKPEYQLIEGVKNLCRLCLKSYTSSFQIFSDDNTTDVCGPLSLRIMICVGLEMTREDCLPNAICSECYKELERCYTFRKKCEMTYQKLKSHVLAVREREQHKILETKQEYESETVIIDKLGQEDVQHLVLSFNEDNPAEIVNVISGIPLGNFQELNGFTNGTIKHISTEDEQNKGIQVQDISVVNSNIPASEDNDSSSTMSTILSSILIELGVLQQQNEGLFIVDRNLKTIELEGDDNSKIVLELVEEDEEGTAVHNTEEQIENNCTEKTTQSQITVKPLNKLYFNNKDDKKNEKDGRWCATCGKRFASRSVAARHQRVHSGERPFECATCGQRFAQREVMTRHELVHQAKRPFACERCPKSFTQRGALLVHARQHAPKHARALALHRCGFCTKVFLYASGLSRHMTVHSGKVFVCNTCGRHFSDKSSLLRHLRKAHAGANTTPDEPTDPPRTYKRGKLIKPQ